MYVAIIVAIIVLLICVTQFEPYVTIEILSVFSAIVILFYILCNDSYSESFNYAEDDFKHIEGGSGHINGGGVDYMKMELMDPKHNLREIAKQMILLEDHMAHKRKRCIDCITKHYLMIEGLIEEAITLDKTKEHHKELNDILEQIKPVMMELISNIKKGKMKDTSFADNAYAKACQTLRTVRKQIGLKYVVSSY